MGLKLGINELPFTLQLIRKEGEFQAPRLLDEKEMKANEDMQQKKKNRKSVTPCKVREQEGRGGKVSGCGCQRGNGLLRFHFSPR